MNNEFVYLVFAPFPYISVYFRIFIYYLFFCVILQPFANTDCKTRKSGVSQIQNHFLFLFSVFFFSIIRNYTIKYG